MPFKHINPNESSENGVRLVSEAPNPNNRSDSVLSIRELESGQTPQSIPSFFSLYRSARNVIPRAAAVRVLL